jgi:hypothetical protein
VLKGSVTGSGTFPVVSTAVCPANDVYVGGLQTAVSATGTASHLGRVSMTAAHCTPRGPISAGKMTFVAANGDRLFADYAGPCDFDPSTAVVGVTVVRCDNTLTFTGGTGRFAGATGSGTLVALLTYMGMGPTAWPGTWTWTADVTW